MVWDLPTVVVSYCMYGFPYRKDFNLSVAGGTAALSVRSRI